VLILFVGNLIDAIVVYVLVQAIDGSWEEAILAFVAIKACIFLVWARASISSWTLFLLSGRKKMAEMICATLERYDYPHPPGQYLPTPDAEPIRWFEEIASDESCAFNTRMDAMRNHSILGFTSGAGRSQEFSRITLAYKSGMRLYWLRLGAKRRGADQP